MLVLLPCTLCQHALLVDTAVQWLPRLHVRHRCIHTCSHRVHGRAATVRGCPFFLLWLLSLSLCIVYRVAYSAVRARRFSGLVPASVIPRALHPFQLFPKLKLGRPRRCSQPCRLQVLQAKASSAFCLDPIARLLSAPSAPASCIVSLHQVHCQSAPSAPLHRRQFHRRTCVDDPFAPSAAPCPKANTDSPAAGTSSKGRLICGPCVKPTCFGRGCGSSWLPSAPLPSVSRSHCHRYRLCCCLLNRHRVGQTYRCRCLRLYRCRRHRYCCHRRSWRRHFLRRLRHRQHRVGQIRRRRCRLRLRRHCQRRWHRCRLDLIRRRHYHCRCRRVGCHPCLHRRAVSIVIVGTAIGVRARNSSSCNTAASPCPITVALATTDRNQAGVEN